MFQNFVRMIGMTPMTTPRAIERPGERLVILTGSLYAEATQAIPQGAFVRLHDRNSALKTNQQAASSDSAAPAFRSRANG